MAAHISGPYLRPVPSMTICSFRLFRGHAHPALVKQGCQLDSLPSTSDLSLQTVTMLGLSADIRHISAQSGNDLSTISLDIALHAPLPLCELQLDKLRFS